MKFILIMTTVVQMICYWWWWWWWYVTDDMLLMRSSNDFQATNEIIVSWKMQSHRLGRPLLRRHLMISKLCVVYRWMGSLGELCGDWLLWSYCKLLSVELLRSKGIDMICITSCEILKRLDNMWLRTTVKLLRIIVVAF